MQGLDRWLPYGLCKGRATRQETLEKLTIVTAPIYVPRITRPMGMLTVRKLTKAPDDIVGPISAAYLKAGHISGKSGGIAH